jgi:hypothetical protein
VEPPNTVLEPAFDVVSAQLTALESAVVEKLLQKHPAFADGVREQLSHAIVSSRDYSGVGFFTNFAIPQGAPVRRELGDAELGGVGAEIGGIEHGAGFILFIRDGAISLLEGYTHGDAKWPENIREFRVYEEHYI